MTHPSSTQLSLDKQKNMDFAEWLVYGQSLGYVSEIVCDTHNGYEMSPTEVELVDAGNDICVHVVRVGNIQDWEAEAQSYKEMEQRCD